MTITIKRQPAGDTLLPAVEILSGVDLSVCYQCKKCTGGCPVADLTQSPPSEIIRRLRLGAGDELLETDLVWLCLSCDTCSARCPMKIDFAAVVDALRALAVAKGVAKPQGDMPLFNREFLRTVKSYGRSYDLSMIMGYKLGTGNLMQDADKFPAMLKKGKMSLLPPSGGNKELVKRIFNRAKQDKGTGK